MRFVVPAALLLFAACAGDDAPAELPPVPWARADVPAAPIPADNPMSEVKIELGWLLFHDPILSTDRAVACVTCHGQIWGLADGIPFAVGVGGIGPAGTGRHGPTQTRRNSQSLWNAAYREDIFWDGRAASLEEQVLGPLDSAIELGRPPAEVIDELRTIPEYVALFGAAFPGEAQPVTVDNLARAIAAFERTLITDHSPYDAYLHGDEGALSAGAVRGMFLLEQVGCTGCHTPPLFASERYENIGLPVDPALVDDGRFEVTGVEADRGAYRVPTLRNARETAPYFHDGSVELLVDACDHGANRALSEAELADLAEFIYKGLMDKSRTPSRALTVPSGLPVPLDGYSVPR
jgi:cytochrome c peroxidase